MGYASPAPRPHGYPTVVSLATYDGAVQGVASLRILTR